MTFCFSIVRKMRLLENNIRKTNKNSNALLEDASDSTEKYSISSTLTNSQCSKSHDLIRVS